MKQYSARQLAGFIVPSVVGIILFMIPIQVDGTMTITVKVIADIIGSALGDFLPLLCVIIVTLSAVLGVISLGKPSFITSYPIVDETFSATPIWAIIRVIGAVFEGEYEPAAIILRARRPSSRRRFPPFRSRSASSCSRKSGSWSTSARTTCSSALSASSAR